MDLRARRCIVGSSRVVSFFSNDAVAKDSSYLRRDASDRTHGSAVVTQSLFSVFECKGFCWRLTVPFRLQRYRTTHGRRIYQREYYMYCELTAFIFGTFNRPNKKTFYKRWKSYTTFIQYAFRIIYTSFVPQPWSNDRKVRFRARSRRKIFDPKIGTEIFPQRRVSGADRPFVIIERPSLLGNYTSRVQQKKRIWHSDAAACENGFAKAG